VDVPETLRSALADRYAIERELGQGGMATVYLAEDLRHHRKVALKVLRPEIAVTVGAGRFSREIEVAARLQHPNILPLLDSGEAAGFFFYVMPYVEGESLRDRLARGGELPVQDAVRILMEVADALSEAHAHGVVHRDIKPDNVMLRGRHALVADFGVAKAVTEATGQQLLTSTGVALGTPMYMAPEQAMADPHQDHRVDIYALGLLGYELLTGRAPFSATTAQEMLAAHVTAVPDPVERYRPTVSPALAQIIMKCLAKKPADRWQTAEEVLAHLEPLATPSGGTTPTQTQPVEVARARRRSLAIAAGGGVLAVAALALLAFQLLKPKPLNITASDITHVTNDPGVEFQPAISPDGNDVAYVAGPILGAQHLFVRSTSGVTAGAAVRLGDSTFAWERFPTWSPDGQSVRFVGRRVAGGGGMFETGRLGGAVRSSPMARGTRSPDGTRTAFIRGDTLFTTLMADTTTRVAAIHPERNTALHSFSWSPDGRLIAYVSGNSDWTLIGNVAPSSIWIASVDGGEPRRVTTDSRLNVSPAWLDARHLLFVSNRGGPRGAYVVEVGPEGARGEPRPVPGVAEPHSISYSTGPRRLAWAQFTLRQNIWSYPLDRTGPISIRDGHPVTTGNQVIEQHDVSPDGRWIVFDDNVRGNQDLYRIPAAGGTPQPLADSPNDEEGPRWSPDGKEVACYVRVGPNRAELVVMPAQGGAPVRLADGPRQSIRPVWSPNGLQLAFVSNRTGPSTTWLIARDSVGGAWHAAAPASATACRGQPDWALNGSALACLDSTMNLLLVSSRDGRVLRSDLLTANRLAWASGIIRLSREGRTVYTAAAHQNGRKGIWAIPLAGGPARLVVAFDDPALFALGFMSVGPDRLYLTVSQYESDIWVAKLRW